MTPTATPAFYADAWATLYLADARLVLPGIDTESVDLVVTDPPYGVGYESGRRKEPFGPILNDSASGRDVVTEVVAHCVRVVGQGRHLYVFGPDVLCGHKVSKTTELIWDKMRNGSGDLSAPWAPSHERIVFAVSKHRHGGEVGRDALPVRMRKGSTLRFAPPTGRKVRHPSEKPVALLRELVESSSRQGDLVLDPFAGVGSTGVAATLSGRRSLLVEREERYATIAAERLAAAAKIYAEGASL